MSKIGASIALCVALLVSLVQVGPVAAQQNDADTGGDAGDAIDLATLIDAGVYTGELTTIDTDDYYKVSVTSGQSVSVSVTPPSGADFDLTLYDTNQLQVDSSALGESQTDTVEGTATASGYFYIYVERFSGSGIYSLTVTVTQDDMGTGGDAGNSLSAATTIPAGTGTGYLDSTDAADHYKVSVSSGQAVSVSMTPPSETDFDLILYDTNQLQIDSSTLGGDRTDTVEGTATASGHFYIYVKRFSGSGIYSLTVTVAGVTTQNDAGSGQDAGDNFAQALTIGAGSYTGYVDSIDNYDYFKVNLSSDQIIDVDLTPPSGFDFDLYLYNPSQSWVGSSTQGGSATDSVSYTTTSSGYHYIEIRRYSGSGVYSFTVSITGTSAAAQDDMGSGTDAGNSFAQALTMGAGSGTGYVGSTDTDDYFKIHVESGQTISASLTPPSGSDFDLYLFDYNQSWVVSSVLAGSQTDSVFYVATSSGYHYVRVHRHSGFGTYSLNISVSTAGALAASPYPYPNNYDRSWTISGGAGTENMRIHFSHLDTENDWDYVYIYDGNNNLVTSYTGTYRDLWSPWVLGSSIKVRLVSDGTITDYGFTVDQVETAAAAPVTPSNKVAVIVGINDYANINGLRYAIADAQDWRNYLSGQGYTISSFLTDSQATEANIRAAITNAATQAGADGTLVLIFSGHGTNSSPGDAHAFVVYDAGATNTGYITGAELRSDLSAYNGRLFVFFDSCYSGGMDGGLINSTKRYMTTTATGAGYGYDMSSYRNGAWTYWFLEQGLVGQGFTTAEQTFSWASANYPYSGNDAPQEFDGDVTSSFNMNP